MTHLLIRDAQLAHLTPPASLPPLRKRSGGFVLSLRRMTYNEIYRLRLKLRAESEMKWIKQRYE